MLPGLKWFSVKEVIVKTWTVWIVAFLGVASMVVEAKPPTSMTVDMTWNFEVDADGHVTRLDTSDKRVPSLHDRLEKEIRGWHFRPGQVNGQPATTESKLYVSLDLESKGGDMYAVRVAGVSTGGGYDKIVTPNYPETALAARRQGVVVLKVRYAENGRVISVVPYEDGPQADASLVRAAIGAVKKWTFEPEIVDGHPMMNDVLVPVCFELGQAGVPHANCDWKKPGITIGMATDHAVALDPAAKLLTDVIGRTL